MSDDEEIQGFSIVVLGSFNPGVFSPGWLRYRNLIGEGEEKAAKVTIIAPFNASFSVGNLQFIVNEGQLNVSTVNPGDFTFVRETVISIFKILTESPVNAVGLNYENHWTPRNGTTYHDFGDELVPKKWWNQAGLRLPGLADLTVRGVRTDDWAGNVNVTVQQSLRIQGGLYARYNDHFDLRKVERQATSRDDFLQDEFKVVPVERDVGNLELALEILRDEFDSSLDRAQSTIRRLKELSR